MIFKIKSVGNGFLLEAKEEGDFGPPDELVYQNVEDGEHEAFVEFLRLLCDNYGPQESRYDAKRIYIVIHPGDKHEDFTNEIFSY